MSTNAIFRIATRKSPLALWQAEFVRQKLKAAHPSLEVELLGLTTEGDKHLEMPLTQVGGKGLFVKELEQALLDGRADIAVHSMKDVPVEFPQGLTLAVICEREDPRDVFVSSHFNDLKSLPKGAVVGTASLRRQCQIMRIRPDLHIQNLRGNVGTRVQRLDAGDFSAIVLAAAGLIRLGMQNRIKHYLSIEECLPAVGQGALGIECRINDQAILEKIKILNHADTHVCVMAERAMNKALNGGCQIPVGAHAQLIQGELFLQGMVGRPDGSEVLRSSVKGNPLDAEKLGISLASDLLAKGAGEILSAYG